MFDALTLAAIAAVFLLAGFVKGVVGFGLPTIALALLAVAFGVPQAMALMLAPAFVSNIWQALAGGGAPQVLRRIWPFLLAAGLFIFVGALALTRVELRWLSALLGVVLIVYALVSLAGLHLSLTARQARWAGPLIGAVNGVLTGMTGSYVVPGVLFLQGIGLPRDQLIQAMGMLFLTSTIALGLALSGNNLLSGELGLLSAAALAPALAGLALGQGLRRRLPEPLFRKVFFAALLALGAYIMARAL
ncbi:sulfite exporter TauE/SafE family protein [Pelagibius marinus]|uniref:sulfite exporter TauE/SafE family protein n=1 Tax=Pelagibius marinus TaxID=2762760 RepID=UPI001873140C|nr:sulfite exporter TauE/SafE family protein [Pelagibius marinus]